MKNAQSVKKHNKKQSRLTGGLVVRSLKTGLEKILDSLPFLAAVRIVVVRGEDSRYLDSILSFNSFEHLKRIMVTRKGSNLQDVPNCPVPHWIDHIFVQVDTTMT